MVWELPMLSVRITIFLFVISIRLTAWLLHRIKGNPEPWLTSIYIAFCQRTIFGMEPPRGLRLAVLLFCMACAVVAALASFTKGTRRKVRVYNPDGSFRIERRRVKLPVLLPRAERAAHRTATASLPARQRAAAWWARRWHARHRAEVQSGVPAESQTPWRRRDDLITKVLNRANGDTPEPQPTTVKDVIQEAVA